MHSSYQLIVFDWEGTLADTLGQILHTLSNEAQKLGFGSIDPEKARQYVDLGLVRALKKIFPHLSQRDHDLLLNHVQIAMTAKSPEVYLIPGALAFTRQLQAAGIHLAIASNKGQQSLQRAIQAAALDDLFKVTRSASQLPAKPCPQMLEEIMEEFNIPAASTLMIGDSVTDIETAKHAGVAAIGVDFYRQQENALAAAGALSVFDSYQKLAVFLGLQMKTI